MRESSAEIMVTRYSRPKFSKEEMSILGREVETILQAQERFDAAGRPEGTEEEVTHLLRELFSQRRARKSSMPEDGARLLGLTLGALRGRFPQISDLTGPTEFRSLREALQPSGGVRHVPTAAMNALLEVGRPDLWNGGRCPAYPVFRWGEPAACVLLVPGLPEREPAFEGQPDHRALSVFDVADSLQRAFRLSQTDVKFSTVGGDGYVPHAVILAWSRQFAAWYPAGAQRYCDWNRAVERLDAVSWRADGVLVVAAEDRDRWAEEVQLELTREGEQLVDQFGAELERTEQDILRNEIAEVIGSSPDLLNVHILAVNLHLALSFSTCLVWKEASEGQWFPIGVSSYAPHCEIAADWNLSSFFTGLPYSHSSSEIDCSWKEGFRSLTEDLSIAPIGLERAPLLFSDLEPFDSLMAKLSRELKQKSALGRWRAVETRSILWIPVEERGGRYGLMLGFPASPSEIAPYSDAIIRFVRSTLLHADRTRRIARTVQLQDLGKQYVHAIMQPVNASANVLQDLEDALAPDLSAEAAGRLTVAVRSARAAAAASRTLEWFHRTADRTKIARAATSVIRADDIVETVAILVEADHEVRIERALEPRTVYANADLLVVALEFALKNACEASKLVPVGGKAPDNGVRVEVTGTTAGKTAIRVWNPVHDLEDDVFDQMTRCLRDGKTYPSRKTRGFGLGLRNIGEIVRCMGGVARLERDSTRVTLEINLSDGERG